MDAKLNHSDLSAMLAKVAGMPLVKAEPFTKAMFDLIIEGLEQDGIVKINGLGTFKLTEVASRSSVNVNTGEKFEIKGHRKLTFAPAETLKECVNQPFAMFEPVEVDETYSDDEHDGEEQIVEDIVLEEVCEVPEVHEAVEEVDAEQEDVNLGTVETENPMMDKTEPETVEPTEVAELPKRPEPVLVRVPKKEKMKFAIPERKKRNFRWLYVVLPVVILFIVASVALYMMYFTIPADSITGKDVMTTTRVLPDMTITRTVTEEFAGSVSVASDTVVSETPTNSNAEMVVDNIVDKQALPEEYEFVMSDELAMLDLKEITLSDTVMYEVVGKLAEHKVVAHETLTRISLKYYGDKRLWPYIVKYNSLARPDDLRKGMIILVPMLKPIK